MFFPIDNFQYPASITINRSFNVLLLALSTFPNDTTEPVKLPEVRSYVFSEPECVIEVQGRYQLEPVPKFLAHKLSKIGEKLDSVIMLCTEQTESEKTIVIGEGIQDSYSPASYFETVLDPYVSSDLSNNNRFCRITYDQSTPAKGVEETVKKLRTLKTEHPDIHLFMDTHGGFRGTQLVLEAIVSLLKNEGFNPEVYSVPFSESQSRTPVKKGDEELRIFDFVSGINELNYSARTDSLKEYLAEARSSKKLLKAMDTISEGIRLCDITKFETGIRDISKELASDKSYQNDPYLSLFINNIKLQYHDLIKPNSEVIDKVNWCLKKGLYQQAITLIEARMPELLFRTGILAITEDDLNVWIKSQGQEYKKSQPYAELLRQMNACLDIWKNDALKVIKGDESFNASVFSSLSSFDAVSNGTAVRFYSPLLSSHNNRSYLICFLRLHWSLYKLRNSLNHAGENIGYYTIQDIKDAIQRYVDLYKSLENALNGISEE